MGGGEAEVAVEAVVAAAVAVAARHLRVADEGDPLEHRDRADDQREVRRDAERELERDLREIGRELLEVDRLGAAAGEGGVEDAGERGDERRGVGVLRDEVEGDEIVADAAR